MLLSAVFPNTIKEPFLPTSPPTPQYNCIAWAMEDTTRWYWPDANNTSYWPSNIPRKLELKSFIQLFESVGYIRCESGSLESGFQKVAIYTKDGVPTHAARQLKNGSWTSKLGPHIDVSHSIFSMHGGNYGSVAAYMKKEIKIATIGATT
jgi:hypothetical protein